MPTDAHHPSTEQRKSALIAQCASYRVGITKSKNVVKTNLHADALAISAVQHFAGRASTIAGALLGLNGLRKGNLSGLVPLLSTAASLLAKRGAIKPMARGAAALAAIGAGAYFLIRRKKRAARAAGAQSNSK
jgi:hypothetical protein